MQSEESHMSTLWQQCSHHKAEHARFNSALFSGHPPPNAEFDKSSEPVFNHAILTHYDFEEPVLNTLGTRKMKILQSFAGLHMENLKTISV